MQDENLVRGRGQFAAIIAFGAAGLLLLGLVDWQRGEDINWVSALGRPIAFAAFGGLAWQGRLWARTVMAVWLALLGALLVGKSIVVVMSGEAVSAMWTGIGLLFLVSAVLLYRSPHIRAVLAERHRVASDAEVAPPAA